MKFSSNNEKWIFHQIQMMKLVQKCIEEKEEMKSIFKCRWWHESIRVLENGAKHPWIIKARTEMKGRMNELIDNSQFVYILYELTPLKSRENLSHSFSWGHFGFFKKSDGGSIAEMQLHLTSLTIYDTPRFWY